MSDYLKSALFVAYGGVAIITTNAVGLSVALVWIVLIAIVFGIVQVSE